MAGPGGSSAPCGGLRRNQAGALLRNAVTGALLSQCPSGGGTPSDPPETKSYKCSWTQREIVRAGVAGPVISEYSFDRDYVESVREDLSPKEFDIAVVQDPDGTVYWATGSLSFNGDFTITPNFIEFDSGPLHHEITMINISSVLWGS